MKCLPTPTEDDLKREQTIDRLSRDLVVTPDSGERCENFELRQKLAEKERALEVAAQLISGRVPR